MFVLIRADSETKAHVRAALHRSATRGTDQVQALDDLGLLWSPDKQKQVMREAAQMVADLLQQSTLRQITPPGERVPQTPLDTKRVIEQWIRQMGEGNVGSGV